MVPGADPGLATCKSYSFRPGLALSSLRLSFNILFSYNQSSWDHKDSTVSRVPNLLTGDPGLIPGLPYDLFSSTKNDPRVKSQE